MTQDGASVPKAAMWMGGWLTLMLGMAVGGREATSELDVFQIMLMRSVIGLLLLYPLVRKHGGLLSMGTQRPLQHVGRNVVHYAAQYGWLLAITMIPLAQVIAIEFTMPIWTAIIAVLLLGERMNIRRIAAVLFGLVGVGIIVRPGMDTIDPGQIIALVVAVGFAVAATMVKSLTRTDSVTVIIFWMLVVQSILGIVPAAVVWKWPTGETWPWVLLIAFCGTFSHYCMARALVHADTTVVVPLDFMRVPLTALAGWLIYNEIFDTWMIVGTALILSGNLFNLRRAGTARIPTD
ncbi:DMT family transporter [Marinivivus vitaminiproducens]|uniref:DMT family transporter n=1 Tax=Marinivivus vitaminiproducens TaxID=3035935 RepID=UPI003FA0375E